METRWLAKTLLGYVDANRGAHGALLALFDAYEVGGAHWGHTGGALGAREGGRVCIAGGPCESGLVSRCNSDLVLQPTRQRQTPSARLSHTLPPQLHHHHLPRSLPTPNPNPQPPRSTR